MSTENRHQYLQKLNSKKSQNQYEIKKRVFSKENSSCEIMLFNNNKTINSNNNNNTRLTRGLSKGHSLENLGLSTRLAHTQKYSFSQNCVGKEKQQNPITASTKNSNMDNKNNRNNNKEVNDLDAIILSKNKQFLMPYARTSTNKIAIVLPQTIVSITETELNSSDIDSSSEGTTENAHISRVKIKQEISNLSQNAERRENKLSFETSSVNGENSVINTTTSTATNIISRHIISRPPLIRAMSAPVRSMHEKSFSNGKRKPRRRKIQIQQQQQQQQQHDDKLHVESNGENQLLGLESRLIGGKKVRSRSVAHRRSDVETFVSLMSSDGSDSEKEDSNCLLSSRNDFFGGRLARRAPSLKKTGKSVSFQETSCYQLTTKDYSHILRTGSVVPRLRNNRPPTTQTNGTFENSDVEPKEKEIQINLNDNFPAYVCSIKERECWKLYQKMSDKGITVTFETILRGMLTPTEFRQSQKQRELEEAKTQMFQEEASESANDLVVK